MKKILTVLFDVSSIFGLIFLMTYATLAVFSRI